MEIHVKQEAAHGLERSGKLRWRFWKRAALNEVEARQSLDRMEQLSPAPEQRAVLDMARKVAALQPTARRRLRVLRQGLTALAGRVSADLTGLAGVAVALRDLSAPETRPQAERELRAKLPDSGLLGRAAPDDGWLLTHAAKPGPRTGQEWAGALEDCPRASVQIVLGELASPAIRTRLAQLQERGLTARVQEQLERYALAQLDHEGSPQPWALGFLTQAERDPSSRARVAGWALEQIPDQPWSQISARLAPSDCDETAWIRQTALERVSAPLDRREAARILREVPGAVQAMRSVLPRDEALALLQGLPSHGEGLKCYGEGQDTPALLLKALAPRLDPETVLASVGSDHPYLRAALSVPWPDRESQAGVATAGWCAAELPGASPASVGLAMARSTDDLNEKLWLARAALRQSPAPAAKHFLKLTELEGTNSAWSRAALGLAALRCLVRNPLADERDLLEVVTDACQTWTSPAWRKILLESTAASLESSGSPLVQAVARRLGQNPDLAVVGELKQALQDSILSSLDQPGAARVEERPDHVLVGGVRLERKAAPGSLEDEAIEAAEAVQSSGTPGPAGTPGTRATTPEGSAAATNAPLPETAPAAPLLDPPPQPGPRVVREWKSEYKNGVGGVYNPATGEIEWKCEYKNGVAGIYDPSKGEVHWVSEYKHGVALVRDPVSGAIHSHSEYKHGVAGLWNPALGAPEWRSEYKHGVSWVPNPATSQAEWRSAYRSGVGGLFDPRTGTVEFREEYKNGVAGVSTDPEYPTLVTTGSPGWLLSDDD